MSKRRQQHIENLGSLDFSRTRRNSFRRNKRNSCIILFAIPFIFIASILVWQGRVLKETKTQLVREISNLEEVSLQKKNVREDEKEAQALKEQALEAKKIELQYLFDEVGNFSALSYEQACEISPKIVGEYARYRIDEEAKQLAWDLVTTSSNKEKRAYIQVFKDNISGLKKEHEMATGVKLSRSVYEDAQEYGDYLLKIFR